MKKSLAVKNYFTLTNFDENLNGYIKQISKYPILDSNKEKELAKKIAEGDLQAKKELVQSNLRLVFNVARKSIHSTSLSMSDLIQEGNMGLMVAIEKFNWKLGYKFSTYATWWIKQAMFKAISEQSYSMKIPVYIQETLSRYKKAKANIEQKTGKNADSAQIAKEIGYSEEKIDLFLNAYSKALSLETGLEAMNNSGAKELSLGEIIEDEKQNVEKEVSDIELKRDILSALNCLKDKEKNVITLRFGLEEENKKTLEEIGNIYGVTKECIRQIEKKAIKKMYSNENNRELLACYIK